MIEFLFVLIILLWDIINIEVVEVVKVVEVVVVDILIVIIVELFFVVVIYLCCGFCVVCVRLLWLFWLLWFFFFLNKVIGSYDDDIGRKSCRRTFLSINYNWCSRWSWSVFFFFVFFDIFWRQKWLLFFFFPDRVTKLAYSQIMIYGMNNRVGPLSFRNDQQSVKIFSQGKITSQLIHFLNISKK